MIRLALVLTRAAGWPRMVLVACCTAPVTTLLLVAITLLRLPAQPREVLVQVVEDPGTRGGSILAAVVLTLPPLLLLHQVVRLGTAEREQRLAALRLAGATPDEVRRLGALEVGIPALVGSVVGTVLFRLLRAVPGSSTPAPDPFRDPIPALRLVPTTVAPTWWQELAVVSAVGGLGVVVGWWASRNVTVSPLGVTRRQPSEPPRPWGAVGLVASALLGAAALLVEPDDPTASGLLGIAAVSCAVVGMLLLAPWTAYLAGRTAQRRTSSAALLIAARRLVADPRAAGRAGAAVGGIALVSGGSAGTAAAAVDDGYTLDSFYAISLALVAAGLLASLAVVVLTVAVHSVESLLDHKRSVASLAALGTTLEELQKAQRQEAVLATVPAAVLGVLMGSLALVGIEAPRGLGLVIVLGNLVLTPVVVFAVIGLSTRLTRPWVRRAAAPANLRTP